MILLYKNICLPIICLIGIITSLEDISFSKIRNKWIVSGLISAFFVYFLSWVFYLYSYNFQLYEIMKASLYYISDFDKWVINLFISFLVGYLFWRIKIWGAGDAKLFICYASLIPLKQYSKVYFGYYFASFELLMNIFIPAACLILFRSVIYFIIFLKKSNFFKDSPKKLSAKIDYKNSTKVFLGFFMLLSILKVISAEFANIFFKFKIEQNLLIIAPILVFRPLSRFFKHKVSYIISSVVLLSVYFTFSKTYGWGMFIMQTRDTFIGTLAVILLFHLAKKIVDIYIDSLVNKNTHFAIWMFLGVLVTWFYNIKF